MWKESREYLEKIEARKKAKKLQINFSHQFIREDLTKFKIRGNHDENKML